MLYLCVAGSIPGPLIFGVIIDNVCVVWQDKCTEQGSCWIYDSGLLGQRLYILAVCVKAVTICLLFIALRLYKPPPVTADQTSNKESTSDDDGSAKIDSLSDKADNEVTKL